MRAARRHIFSVLALNPLDQIRKLLLKEVDGVIVGIGPADDDFEDLLAEIAFTGEDGTNTTGLGIVVHELAGVLAGGNAVGPQAVEYVNKARPGGERLVAERHGDPIWLDGNAAIVLRQLGAGGGKTDVRPMSL